MRLIDADILSEAINTGAGTDLQKFFADVCLAAAPTIDAVPVVRCQDCKHWETDWEPNYFNPDNPMYYCAETDLFTTGNWFCKDGQRREEEHNAVD